MENSIITPFYLKSPKKILKGKITAGVIILTVSFCAPPLFVLTFIYFIYLIFEIKKIRGEEGKLSQKAINFYIKKDYIGCMRCCDNILSLKENDYRAKTLKALSLYENTDYNGFLDLIKTMMDKERIRNDVDIQLKIGQSYENLNMNSEAKSLYKKMLTVFKKSEFLKEKIDKL